MRGLFKAIKERLGIPENQDIRPLIQRINVDAILDLVGTHNPGSKWFDYLKMMSLAWETWRLIAEGKLQFSKEDLENGNSAKFAELIKETVKYLEQHPEIVNSRPKLKRALEIYNKYVASKVTA